MNAIEFIEQSLSTQIIVDFLRAIGGTKVTPLGEQIRGTCPIHNGNNRTAFVWNIKCNLWYCHTQCKKGGDIFTLVAERYELDEKKEFKKIVEKTAQILGLDIESMTLGERRSDLQKELEQFKKLLSPLTVHKQQEFDLSIFEPKRSVANWRGLEQEVLQKSGAFYSTLDGAMIFPILDKDGITIGVSKRFIKPKPNGLRWEHCPPGIKTGDVVYNLNNILAKDDFSSDDIVYITEGIVDCLKLVQLGYKAVCIFGSSIKFIQLLELLSHFTKLCLAFDNDKVGKEATKQYIDLLKHKCDLYVLEYPTVDLGELQGGETLKTVKYWRWGHGQVLF